jgi:AraC-like DNA-binding protein
MYRLVHEGSACKFADEKLFIAKIGTVTVFRASSAAGIESVSSVAAPLGYLSDAVFGVAFRRECGVNPP